ncbi:MAG: hypothetical protein ACRD8Z_06305 [Nitrososphaeraceae archaeon]
MDLLSAIKNLSKYGLSEDVVRECNLTSGSTLIPKLCYLLKSKGYSNKSIKNIARHDLIDIWCRKTIDSNIPKEFLDPEGKPISRYSLT